MQASGDILSSSLSDVIGSIEIDISDSELLAAAAFSCSSIDTGGDGGSRLAGC